MAIFSLVTLLLLVIVAALIILLFMFYPKYYRSLVNKSLEGNKPVRAIEPTVLYGGILLAIIIIFNIVTLSSNRSLETQVNNLSSQIRTLESNNESLINHSYDLEHKINQAINKDSLIQFIKFEVVEEDESISGNYIVKLTYVITDNVTDEDLTLYVEKGTEVTTHEIDESITRQTIDLSLDLDADYVLYVQYDDNGEDVKEDIYELNLYNYLYDRFDIQFDLDYDGNDQYVSVYVSNKWTNPSSGVPTGLMEIESVQFVLTDGSDGVILDEMLTSNLWSSHAEYFSFYEKLNENHGSLMFKIIITDKAGITYGN